MVDENDPLSGTCDKCQTAGELETCPSCNKALCPKCWGVAKLYKDTVAFCLKCRGGK